MLHYKLTSHALFPWIDVATVSMTSFERHQLTSQMLLHAEIGREREGVGEREKEREWERERKRWSGR